MFEKVLLIAAPEDMLGDNSLKHSPPLVLACMDPSSPATSFQTRSSAAMSLTSDCDRPVSITVDIPTPIPNRVFTLVLSTITAILHRVDTDFSTKRSLFALCKKFAMAQTELDQDKRVIPAADGPMILSGGRVYPSSGPSVRLPPVLDLWGHCGSWWAMTTRGLYGFGENEVGALGVGMPGFVEKPRRVNIGAVLDVVGGDGSTFFRTTDGWWACGSNHWAELGLGHNRPAERPERVPYPGVARVQTESSVTFGWTGDGTLLAAGNNNDGQTGVGRPGMLVDRLTPVALPDDVKGRVDRVVSCDGATFILCDDQCLACGNNLYGQLGLGLTDEKVRRPAALPFPVDDVVVNDVTVFLSDGRLLACGDNRSRQISWSSGGTVRVPVSLDLPGPVTAVGLSVYRVRLRLTDGTWVTRGAYARRHTPTERPSGTVMELPNPVGGGAGCVAI